MDVNTSLLAMGLALVFNARLPLLVFHRRLWGSRSEATTRDVHYGQCESVATLMNCLCGASWLSVRPVCPAALSGSTKDWHCIPNPALLLQ